MGLKYYNDMKDAPSSDLFRKVSIKTENQLMDFSDSGWKDCPYIGRRTVAYNIFYQGGPIYQETHVPVPVTQSSEENEYNAACIAGIHLAHFRMLIHEFLNKDPDIFPEEYRLIILDSKSAVFMARNYNNIKHTRHIPRRVHFVRNVENCKIHKIDWCEGCLLLADIATKNVGENDLNSRMKYIMVRTDNWERTLVQEWWKDTV